MPESAQMAKDAAAYKGVVTLKEYLMDTINERDRKYEQRFAALDKSVADANLSIKDALEKATQNTQEALKTATQNTQAALATANENIRGALVALDKRFEAVNEFRGQLSDQQELFARKTEIVQSIEAMEKAMVKAEVSTEKRLESMNEFRLQLATQQETFVRRSEVEVHIKALSDKIDVIQSTHLHNAGKTQGITAIGSVVLSVLVGLAALASVVALFSNFSAHGH